MSTQTARQARPPRIPMMPGNTLHLKLTFHADLVAFISDPTPLAYNRLLRILDILAIISQVQRMADYRLQIQSARRAMTAILSRFERTGTLAVTPLDASTLRTAAPFIESAIGRTRLDAFTLANAIVQHKMQLDGVATTD
ncbi:hypothetical protein [Cupriavidus sp. WS]|uniref:hypothetical protein n=1 Tax=Cupriavidus sp. WS TaxID=1312922 RepID=UPI0003813870|nr:hypothetical protein [Cupriavidus sp. WS]